MAISRCVQEMKSKAQAIRRGALMVSDLLPGNDNAWLRMTRTMLAIQEAITSTLQPTPDRAEAHILIQNRTQYNQYLRTRSLKTKAHMSKLKKDKRTSASLLLRISPGLPSLIASSSASPPPASLLVVEKVVLWG